jgi:hypothetical protein
MFHTYIAASSGRQIDIDRARLEADEQLWRDAAAAVIRETCPQGFNPFDVAAAERIHGSTVAQRTWWRYCVHHLRKYGAAFEPDVSPTWDQ